MKKRPVARQPAICFAIFALCMIMFSACPGLAQDDPILAALQAEVDRAMKDLVLPGNPRPYFVSCSLASDETVSADASLGALIESGRSTRSTLLVTVRVGDYALDDSNFAPKDMWSGWSSLEQAIDIPIDGNTDVVRRAAWWSMDKAYKTAIENLKRKKTVMANREMPNVADDFSRQSAASFFSKETPQELPPENVLAEGARALSSVLATNVSLRESTVSLTARTRRRWLVNSEGTRVFALRNGAFMTGRAIAQADDGVMVGDTCRVVAWTWNSMPTPELLASEVAGLGRRVEAMRTAPLQDDFIGPVLVEGQASGELCARILPGAFTSRRKPMDEDNDGSWYSRRMADSLRWRIGRRVMAREFTVVDDPSLTAHEGTPLMGFSDVDLEGVESQKVLLVKDGILKTLLTTRTPDRKLPASNGHAVSMIFGPSRDWIPEAGVTTLVVSYRHGCNAKALRARFLKTIREQEVEYGLLVRRIPELGSMDESARYSSRYRPNKATDFVVEEPLYAFRVYPDGREELVRIASFKGISLPAFKDVLAAGDSLSAFNCWNDGSFFSILSPALLFEEGLVMRPEQNIKKCPLLPSPMTATDGASAPGNP